MTNAIIIFVRNPELGKVKTRLARSVGDEKALKVYKELLQHTHDIVISLDCDKFVYYSDVIKEGDIWESNLFYKKIQQDGILGERMSHAFCELFGIGYKRIVIIGSDCPGLTSGIILTAFDNLNKEDAVIGPSFDGGYYLLGLSGLIPELFSNKAWSTATVLIDTINDLARLQKKYSVLFHLSDIDTVEDYNDHYLSN